MSLIVCSLALVEICNLRLFTHVITLVLVAAIEARDSASGHHLHVFHTSQNPDNLQVHVVGRTVERTTQSVNRGSLLLGHAVASLRRRGTPTIYALATSNVQGAKTAVASTTDKVPVIISSRLNVLEVRNIWPSVSTLREEFGEVSVQHIVVELNSGTVMVAKAMNFLVGGIVISSCGSLLNLTR